MRRIRLRHEEHAACEAIQPVYDARTQIAALGREAREPVQQSVYHGAGVHARARMYDHAGGFFDYHCARVFIENSEGNSFRLGSEWRRKGRLQIDSSLPRTW